MDPRDRQRLQHHGLATIVPGRYAAVLRAQNRFGRWPRQLRCAGTGVQWQWRTAEQPPVRQHRPHPGGHEPLEHGHYLVSSFKSGTGGNSIHAVLTDEFGNGGCTGIAVQPQWTEYTPTIFNHSSTQQTGHDLSSWITPSTQPSLSASIRVLHLSRGGQLRNTAGRCALVLLHQYLHRRRNCFLEHRWYHVFGDVRPNIPSLHQAPTRSV